MSVRSGYEVSTLWGDLPVSAEEAPNTDPFTGIQRKLDQLLQERDAIAQHQHQGFGDVERYNAISDEIGLLDEEMSRLKQKAASGQG